MFKIDNGSPFRKKILPNKKNRALVPRRMRRKRCLALLCSMFWRNRNSTKIKAMGKVILFSFDPIAKKNERNTIVKRPIFFEIFFVCLASR